MQGKVVIIYSDPLVETHDVLGRGASVSDVLDSVLPLQRTLVELGRDSTLLPLRPPLAQATVQLSQLDAADVVFNLFEGFQRCTGSEAAIAGVLEEMGVRFTGSPSIGLRLTENKAVAKGVLRSSWVTTPEWLTLSPQSPVDVDLCLPWIVKPLTEHGSYGITEDSVVADTQSLGERVEWIYQEYQCPSIVEEFLPGREFRAFVIGDGHPRVLPVVETVYMLPPHRPRLLTYRAKWVSDDEYFVGTKEVCPAEIEADLREELESLALRSFTALRCRGYASIDMRQNEEGQPMVIDVNPNTDISLEGCSRFPIEAAGIEYAAFIEEVLSLV